MLPVVVQRAAVSLCTRLRARARAWVSAPVLGGVPPRIVALGVCAAVPARVRRAGRACAGAGCVGCACTLCELRVSVAVVGARACVWLGVRVPGASRARRLV